jgi:murein DD-endopeptidase MepM/ murein hydrolase activator NlpD
VVRVLHEDGTMALYAHLSWNSIRVVPGERVARGQYLADSGNTGFSTGPHLHFVIQRNRGGAIVSVPVEFAGAAGSPVTLRRGAEYTAY